MRRTLFDVLALTALRLITFLAAALAAIYISLPYFFLFAMVFLGPLRVRALVFVRWPLHRQAAAMTHAAIAADLDQPLDVHRDVHGAGHLR